MKVWPSLHDPYERGLRFRFEFALRASVLALGIVMMGYFAFSGLAVQAHPGGLAADGCHNDRKAGGRHCHRGTTSAPSEPKAKPFASSGSTYYANCSEARAAGAAPVRRGDPGYSSRLDRDGDGVGCE